jgi:hypothetical protein
LAITPAWRAQHGVLGLVAGHVELGLGLLQAGEAGTVEVFGVVELRVADHLPVQQLLVAFALGAHQRQVGFGGGHLGAVGFQLQAHVLRVELGQRLFGLDPLPSSTRRLLTLPPMRNASSGSKRARTSPG